MQSPAIDDLDQFVFGHAPRPVRCGRDMVIGSGSVIPEINFTLPPIEISHDHWSMVRDQYTEMIESVLKRAVELQIPALLVEFETLPAMTNRPEWALDITRLLSDHLEEYYVRHRLRSALRFTPNDTREFRRPPLMREGIHWERMRRPCSTKRPEPEPT